MGEPDGVWKEKMTNELAVYYLFVSPQKLSVVTVVAGFGISG